MWQEAKDKNAWNELVGKQPHARFLQSWQWGEFQQSLGRKLLRLSWHNESFVQATKMNLPGGLGYWYIPHEPIAVTAEAWGDLVTVLGEHGALFLRVDPATEIFSSPRSGGYGVVPVPATQPQCTSVLDLSQTEDELLAAMHQKTRYNIRVAERKGVVIGEGTVEDFLRLNRETKTRGNFIPHPDAYYQKMAETLSGDFFKIWQARYDGAVVASVSIISFGDTATYAHGASANEHREVMAPYLLHWEIMKDAKKRGVRYYDLGGVNPPRVHPAYKRSWEGITRFKSGFGGTPTCYPNSFDLIYKPWWYRVYRLARNVRRII